MEQTLSLIRARTATRPDEIALMMPESAVTYAMLGQGIGSVATWCRDNLDPAEPLVALCVASPVRATILALGLYQAGFTSVAANPMLLADAVEFGTRTALVDARLPSVGGLRQCIVDEAMFGGPASARTGLSWPGNRVARVEFTSGSTGSKKPVGFTSGAVDRQTLNRIAAYGIEAQRAVCMFPVSANVGFGFVLGMLAQGKTVAFAGSNDEFIHLLRQFAVPCILGSPAQLTTLMRRHEELGISASPVRRIVLAGSAVGAGLLGRLRVVFGAEVLVDYGSTETGPAALTEASGLMDGPYRVYPHQSVTVTAPPGQVGPISIRSSGMGQPFAGDIEQTGESHESWRFEPGDLGIQNTDGSVTVVGRADFLINVGGTKLAPEAIEDRLSAQFGGARICAMPADGSGELCLFHEEGAAYEAGRVKTVLSGVLPRMTSVRFVPVAELPMTLSGKIDRNALRALAMNSQEAGSVKPSGR